jgi:hypothetical protein
MKNATANTYSCYVDKGAVGTAVADGDDFGVLASSNTGTKQACGSVPDFTVSSYTGVGGAEFHGDTMTSGMILGKSQYISSQNAIYALVFQSDSNLAMYSGVSTPLWMPNNNLGTAGSNADRLAMQTDGNLVMYRPDNSVVWNSQTGGHPGAWAKLQSDGNFVVYSATGTAL